jgi:multidrug efflux pump subunit AcrB
LPDPSRGLAGIIMRNTLILIGQIRTNERQGLDAYHAVVEATVQRSRPVILTALAAVLAFIPLTFSVFFIGDRVLARQRGPLPRDRR